MWQDLLALDAHVGAPPDGFNVDGQDWGLPPFVPWKLRAAHFEPFIKTVRAAMRGVARAARRPRHGPVPTLLDPARRLAEDRAPTSTCRRSELLDLLALESARAGAFVVGEDLGTVEDEVREDLAERGILSYRLMWFEDDASPSAIPCRRSPR